ncbi:uncharacterized protein B0I36DRAFT_34200 [Microdochium trichocladiopsis]|uniref:DUF3295 domain-containing protein n=1 Tax=Microdochium trichocladiopsis TaxID=1682393 RepID=A0A9P8XWU0_9PEZI|nr:uncharacterized protein B0I36DRAFT_34200 [Microdochium trichocladiopsis]KAH7021635.1 hypothetical protein B0I36DRAFT_34200 [Microdochium trichocladiopsis]
MSASMTRTPAPCESSSGGQSPPLEISLARLDPGTQKKPASFAGIVAAHRASQQAVSDQSDDYDESAIDDDDSDSDWHSIKSSESSQDDRITFTRIPSKSALTSQQSLISLMFAGQRQGTKASSSHTSQSTAAIPQRSRTMQAMPTMTSSPNDSDEGLQMKKGMRPPQLKRVNEILRSPAQPITAHTQPICPRVPPKSNLTAQRFLIRLMSAGQDQCTKALSSHASQPTPGIPQRSRTIQNMSTMAKAPSDSDNGLQMKKGMRPPQLKRINEILRSTTQPITAHTQPITAHTQPITVHVQPVTAQQSLLSLIFPRGGQGTAASNSHASQQTHDSPQRSRTTQNTSPIRNSPDDSNEGRKIKLEPEYHQNNDINEIPRSKPQRTEAIVLSPRTTRRNMLANELTESVRRQLLWERQQKTSTANAVLKRRHTSHDVANLKQYPEKVHMNKEAAEPSMDWNRYFNRDTQGGYHAQGW